MTGLFFIFSNSVLVKINQISYNSHYVKWRLDWWKTPVFETSNRSSFVQLVIVISI